MKTLLPLVIFFLLTSTLAATPGDLDETFGGDGKVTTDISNGSRDFAQDVEVDADGKLVVLGLVNARGDDNTYSPIAIARYNNDGTLDNTFGIGGIALSEDTGLDLEIDANGKLLLLGWSKALSQPALIRYNANGSLDTTFGTNGYALLPHEGMNPNYRYIVLTPEGNVVIAGSSDNTLLVIRLLRDGTLDTSFGTDGLSIPSDLVFRSVTLAGVALNADGKIIVGTTYRPVEGDVDDFYLTRLNTDGSLDTTFGDNGVTITDFGNSTDYAFGMTQDTTGRILLAGMSFSSQRRTDIAVARYTSEGVLDTSFGLDGKVITDFANTGDIGHSVVVSPAGKIIVASTSASTADDENFAAFRYNENGTLDTTFSVDGKVVIGFGYSDDKSPYLTLDAEGNLVVVGTVSVNDGNFFDFGIARLKMDGTPRTELLLNGGFETSGADEKTLANWTGSNLTKDVRKCNKPEKYKYYAFEDSCIFQFKSSLNERAILTQNIDTTGVPVGGELQLSVWAKSRTSSKANAKVKMQYTDGTKEVLKLNITPNFVRYQSFISNTFPTSKPMSSLKVQINFKATTGKLLLDAMSLTVVAPEALVPLPN